MPETSSPRWYVRSWNSAGARRGRCSCSPWLLSMRIDTGSGLCCDVGYEVDGKLGRREVEVAVIGDVMVLSETIIVHYVLLMSCVSE